MAQQIDVFALQAWQPEFHFQNPRNGGKDQLHHAVP